MAYRVAANLVLGADGSTSLHGSSAGLSLPEDRARFHDLRREFKAILIGGNTARNEPYKRTPLPLIVLSHQPLPERLGSNEKALAWNLPLSVAIPQAGGTYGDLLLEGGPAFIQEAIACGQLTELYLTISPLTPAENQIDILELTANAEELSRYELGGSLFLHYRLAPSHE